jgi:hypothetical protein
MEIEVLVDEVLLDGLQLGVVRLFLHDHQHGFRFLSCGCVPDAGIRR